MISCKHCQSPNTLDSTFCKRCGTALPDSELIAAREALEKMVDQGNMAMAEGRVEEALAIAELATTTDPTSTNAIRLKMVAQERKGHIAEALECAEKLVELNPSSDLDKIKRNQLRSSLASSYSTAREPNRSLFAMAGVAVMVIVLCGAVIYARRPLTDRAKLVSNDPAVKFAPSSQLLNQPINQVNPPQSPVQTPVPNQPTPTVPQSGPAAGQEQQSDESDSKPLPSPGKSNSASEGGEVPPVDIVPIPTPPQKESKQATDPGPASTPQTGTKSAAAPGTAPTPPGIYEAPEAVVDPGQIEIRVHNGPGQHKPVSSGSDSIRSDGGARAYSQAGNEQFLIGNWSGAASNLEQALQNGGDPITLNQRLGHAYEHMGRKSEATSAYQRAIAACQSAISSGRGDSSRMKATKEACEAALDNLKGG